MSSSSTASPSGPWPSSLWTAPNIFPDFDFTSFSSVSSESDIASLTQKYAKLCQMLHACPEASELQQLISKIKSDEVTALLSPHLPGRLMRQSKPAKAFRLVLEPTMILFGDEPAAHEDSLDSWKYEVITATRHRMSDMCFLRDLINFDVLAVHPLTAAKLHYYFSVRDSKLENTAEAVKEHAPEAVALFHWVRYMFQAVSILASLRPVLEALCAVDTRIKELNGGSNTHSEEHGPSPFFLPLSRLHS